LTTAEGGAVSSPNSELLDKARLFSRQGLIRDFSKFRINNQGSWHQEVHNFGLNYRLPDVLCALGSSQLQRLAEFKKRRNEIFQTYAEAFSDLETVVLPSKREYVDPTWHLFPIRVPASIRRSVFDQLKAAEIGVQVNYIPAYLHPVFDTEKYPRGLCPVAEKFYSEEISLPIHFNLSAKDLERIIQALFNSIAHK
jgi:dTDP-4-amino-4,6-dideoxygalactose transaminase